MTIVNPQPRLSPEQQAAQDAARNKITGQFGEQHHSQPGFELEPYPYPALRNGLSADQVDLNVYERENDEGELVWHVIAHSIVKDDEGFEDTDFGTELFESFELPLSDKTAGTLDEDNWYSLDTAPAWLRDAVLPSLVDHGSTGTENAVWRRARHDQLMAQGAFATAYDNDYIAAFEADHPTALPTDAAWALMDLPELDEHIDDDPEREAAAAELSRRAAAGVGGLLADARELRAGDQVSLTHLREHLPSRHEWAADQHMTVTGVTGSGTDGQIAVAFDGGLTLYLPAGSRLPAVGFQRGDKQLSGADLVAELVTTGETSYRSSMELTPAQIAEKFNTLRELDPSDPDYIDTLTPTLTGARL